MLPIIDYNLAAIFDKPIYFFLLIMTLVLVCVNEVTSLMQASISTRFLISERPRRRAL
jgi:hypothetical protein